MLAPWSFDGLLLDNKFHSICLGLFIYIDIWFAINSDILLYFVSPNGSDPKAPEQQEKPNVDEEDNEQEKNESPIEPDNSEDLGDLEETPTDPNEEILIPNLEN